tara:strand:+ start:2787 stop:3131 length:345 start_codon:yes stop_codon:yes gene_type:complete
MDTESTPTTVAEDSILRKISNHLKNKHSMHALSHEVIPTRRTIGAEVVNRMPALYIPELKVPIEVTVSKERDDDYLALGMLPLVAVPSRMRFDSPEEFVDSFIDFHTKWTEGRI